MVMMKMTTQDPNIPIITTTTCPTWKLYENPFYIQDSTTTTTSNQIHTLHLPISSRKIAASFFDLTFIMESELAQIKAELESERKARKKMESLNKRLTREAAEERRRREDLIAEITKMKRDMDEERKMLRTAEVIREERVQMKLSEAKIFLEEKLSELQINGSRNEKLPAADSVALTENPHIKRGIKGFVEFPKVVRAIGCRSSKHLATKLECQKAQLKILLKQKGPVRFTGLIAR